MYAKGGTKTNMATGVDLQKAVRQLISSVTSPPSGSQSKVLSLEDAVANLETTDENFHSYDLVKYVHGQIESVVDPLIDERLKKHGGLSHGEEHDIVALITDDILTSPEYTELCQSTVCEVKDAVDLLLHSDIPDSNDLSSNATSLSGGSSRTQYYPLDDSDTSELSSLKETGLFFIPHDQLIDITDQLKPNRTNEVRLGALQQLHQFPPGDLPQCDTWSSLSSSLEDCIMSDCNSLADSSLKLLSRMFDSTTSYKAREVYRILLCGLVTYFRGPGKANIETGLDPSTETNTKLLQRFRMMQHIQVELPTYWLRYNERIIEDIMNVTLSLLELSYDDKVGGVGGGVKATEYLTPLHYLSVIDPNAHWFQKWMHTQYSRVQMIESLKKSDTTLKGLLQHFLTKGFKSNNGGKKGEGTNKGTSSNSSSSPPSLSPSCYSPAGLSYLHSLHTLNVVSHLLLYSQGRDVIGAVLQKINNNGINNVSSLIQHLIELLLNWPQSNLKKMSCDSHVSLDPTVVLRNLFGELASRNNLCSSLLCQDNVMDVILSHLNSSTKSKVVNVSLVDIINNSLAVLASTDNGKCYLLKASPKRKESVADTIAQFVVKSLQSGHAHNSSNSQLVYSCLLVCRQLYSTCDGVLSLLPYDLHLHIVKAIQSVGVAGGVANSDDTLKTKLIDNLLNFAGTPKGIELLEGSGLIGECINHMRRRYQLKLQVSQCEKFGYGYMVSEVASTSTGITHLINSGYVCDLVDDLWVLLNGSMSCDVDVIKRDPFDPADRVMYKSIINILNVISSYPAFHKSLLSKAPPKTASTDVVTVSGLLEALVFKYGGTEEPMTAVRNNDDAHLCGLRIISILTTSLDSFVLLETQFSLRETIASFQHVCRLENNEYIIDACSVERNRLLVSSSCIGGPKERLLPPHTLTTISDVYEYPFYVRLKEKVPDCYTLKVSYSHHKPALNVKPSATINDFKSCYMKHLKQHTTLSTKDVSTLLVQSLASLDQTLPQAAEEKASGGVSPSSGQDVVLNLMLNYSKHIGLSNISKDSLWQILQKFNSFATTPSQNSADWFVVIVSLILLQSHDQSCDTVRQFLRRFSSSATSLYVWRQRENLKPLLNFDTSKIHTFILHYIEFIIQAELPLVYSAFRLSGYTPSQVCQDWLGQCFLNYLDWPEICLYLINCILLGADYQVYFCVAIFKHLEANILKSCQEHTLLIFLKEEPLRGFTTKQSLSFMSQLELKYRSNILKDLQTVQP